MRNDTPTALLREQHRLILRVVDAFERGLAAPDGELPPADDVAEFITFFRLFTDACHHGKEEDVLFDAMEEAGLSGPLEAMREEHRVGREIVASIADALDGLRAARADAATSLRNRAAEYIDFIRGHIAREDDGIFEMADNLLAGPACRTVCDAYETVCARRFDGRSVSDLERAAAVLIDRYADGDSGR